MNNQVSDTSSGEPLVYRAIVEIAYYKCCIEKKSRTSIKKNGRCCLLVPSSTGTVNATINLLEHFKQNFFVWPINNPLR
jgi:hypothetical protein